MSGSNEIEELAQRVAGPSLKHTAVTGVYRLDTSPSKHSQKLKENLLSSVAGILPEVAIWVPRHDADLLESLGRTTPSGASSAHGYWEVFPSYEMPRILGILYRGAWGLFFGEAGRITKTGPLQLSFDPRDLLALTEAGEARVGVVSWHDDNSWLVCIR